MRQGFVAGVFREPWRCASRPATDTNSGNSLPSARSLSIFFRQDFAVSIAGNTTTARMREIGTRLA